MSSTDIYEAIKKLPKELVTPEIYRAAINEANIALLNILPKEYMTDDNINLILDNAKGYSFDTFSLSSIPEIARTQKVCDMSVGKSLENYFKVPEEKRSVYMLEQIIGSAHKHLHYLPLVPEKNWDAQIALDGVKSIYSSGSSSSSYSYGRRGGYSNSSSSDKKVQMKLIQILLAYVPDVIKDKSFYFSLFNTSMAVEYIAFLTPDKYKKNDYYAEVGKKDILSVPQDKLNYDVLKAALLSGNNRVHDFFDEKKGLRQPLLDVMDDEMADIIVKDSPGRLSDLPQKFWKKSRLILAINSEKDSYKTKYIYDKFDASKFDDEICRAIVLKQNYESPEFAPQIWTQDFINFCMENCKDYYWFRRLPVELQTQEMVNTILGKYISKIQYARQDLVTYDLAVEAYKDVDTWSKKHKLEEYIPARYFQDFTMETGLPKEFFAGKCSYEEVREKHGNYTYCEIGEAYIGFFADKDGRFECNRLVMTRRSPMSIKPSIVFSRTVSTFHKTWFEKLIADNDPQFVKPVPAKGLKGKQVNPYLDVRLVDTADGTKIYAHSLMNANVLYTAGDNNEYEAVSLDLIKRKLKKETAEYEIAS
ncbi:hypothetical protein [Dysgonomonas termitidis]|uniref:RES domain-containing protein n=1 Tax=Dysgonomonas termitidis TaxID=1516126 RepID=A0ABV9KS25_9BACT